MRCTSTCTTEKVSFVLARRRQTLASLRGETFELESSGCARKFNIFLDKAATCGGTRLDASPALLSSLY